MINKKKKCINARRRPAEGKCGISVQIIVPSKPENEQAILTRGNITGNNR